MLGSDCDGEVRSLRARVTSLEAELARLRHLLVPAPALPQLDATHARRLSSYESCKREKRRNTNLLRLLPSAPDADMSEHDGRCSRRYGDIDSAWEACMAEPACAGIVRDNGLRCRGGEANRRRALGKNRGRRSGDTLDFELRGGGVAQGSTTAWICGSRLRALTPVAGTTYRRHNNVKLNNASAAQGYVFIALGPCALPSYNCSFLQEARNAIRALREVDSARPIAVLSDGGVPTQALLQATEADLITVLDSYSGAARSAGTASDLRVRKLLAYGQSPFESTVFFDGDTFARTSNVAMLFAALEHFELAAAFECCRIDYGYSALNFDKDDFFRGWEMQTGVMAYRKTPRLAAFWQATIDEFSQREAYWTSRSSGEQGAATLALSRVDVRFMPLPPVFNARPYTMMHYVNVFGVPVYHGKDLWTRMDLQGKYEPNADAIISQRMLRDWNGTAEVLRTEFVSGRTSPLLMKSPWMPPVRG